MQGADTTVEPRSVAGRPRDSSNPAPLRRRLSPAIGWRRALPSRPNADYLHSSRLCETTQRVQRAICDFAPQPPRLDHASASAR